MLQQLDRDLNTTLELDTVLRLTLEWALRILKGTAGAIALINGDDHQLQIRGLRGYSNRFDPADIERYQPDLVIYEFVERGLLYRPDDLLLRHAAQGQGGIEHAK